MYGKYHRTINEDLKGTILVIIKDKYGNFTKDKEYLVEDRNRITDDDGDYYTLGVNDIGRLFRIK